MAGGKENQTPARPPPSLKKQSSSTASTGKQQSILGFFGKSTQNSSATRPIATLSSVAQSPTNVTTENGTGNAGWNISTHARRTSLSKSGTGKPVFRNTQSKGLTPVPSSDAPGPLDEDAEMGGVDGSGTVFSSPSRKARKVVNYQESEGSDDDDDDVVPTQRRRNARPARAIESDEDEFGGDDTFDDDDDDIEAFIADYDSDEAPVKPSNKRKRPVTSNTSRKRSNVSPLQVTKIEEDDEADLEVPTASTAQQWKFDPDNTQPLQPRSANAVKTPKTLKYGEKPKKEQACKTAPEARYSWLANMTDMDGNPVGSPDYDPRTLYIPPMAWTKFSPFEKQYWEIKQKFWDTVVFFKKGKFYELYEKDATIGAQLFDLKMTDRVNMRMVGVPESVLDHWANQFVAKGFKIARVDQMETALGKEMRERESSTGPGSAKSKPKDKVITRELACVLTKGTLVEGSMLEGDMSTYCVAIKEGSIDDQPAFGITFVDASTGEFFLSEFVDDVDLTKFETFVAQTRPQELILERSTISTKALRILKNNTTPTTIWNYLKSEKEFWTADETRRQLDSSDYFLRKDDSLDAEWPEALRDARDMDLVISAFGAMTQYLRTLKIERDLLSQCNFSWYDPIQKATTLVLDGQTLINLEIFANTFDGSSDGTLFTLLNRCITPFGKRLFKQWVCHPLGDAKRINERLDAVEALNANTTVREQFSAQMTRMPDLERLISRIHAGVCKPEDFCKVLDGFEQIEYTMGLLKSFSGDDGLIGRLIKAMPDLTQPLAFWKEAFDRKKARDDKLLIPERGIDEAFDESADRIQAVEADLNSLLHSTRKKFGGAKINFKDIGKEVYQMEVPDKMKGVPKNWSVISNAKGVTRYYFPELKSLVRELQEAQEMHAQSVKLTASVFFKRFDEDYATWLSAVKIVSNLDCLIGLAKASSNLGEPSCRPVFVQDERSVIEFEELRHPCMGNVDDFIPNDIRLGGEEANISLLTGANAAGKSTILRMTCIAIIMAQLGCFVPAVSARLTPVDRIMSRLGAQDNIFVSQSTFFVELSETKKILSEATPRSLVILDELGRGTSSYDGVAVAQAVLHHIASHIGCIGFFATHYHSLAAEFSNHPEVTSKRMAIEVEEAEKRITFLYKLEEGVAEGSFGMHCAAMCGIQKKIIDKAEEAAREFEFTSRLKESLEAVREVGGGVWVPLGIQSDVAWMLREGGENEGIGDRGVECLLKAIEGL